MSLELGGFETKDVMLDLGGDVNILLKKTWELMGKLKPMWFPIHLRLENQYKVFPMGRLMDMEFDVDGVKIVAEFEVIDILEDVNPYQYLLGIYLAFVKNVIMNLKEIHMSF